MMIPAFKLQPQTIPLPELLKTIDEYSGDYSRLEDHVYSLWFTSSKRIRPPSKRNALRAVIGPSLRHLDLVRGEGNSFKLTGSAIFLLQKYFEGGESNFKKWLAAHLVHKDAQNWLDVLSTLEKNNKEMLMSELIQTYETENSSNLIINEDKLKKYLRFFEYCDLISIKDNLVKAHEKQIYAARNQSFVLISNTDFSCVLIEAYNQLKDFSRGPFVAIPDLRDQVCKQTGIFSDDFNDMLISLPRETEDWILEYAQPMTRQEGKGLHIGAIYMYYLAIHLKKGAADG